MKTTLAVLFFGVAMIWQGKCFSEQPSSAGRVSVVDVIEYGLYYYAKLPDGSLWSIAPEDEDIIKGLSPTAPFEIVRSYATDFPYYLYSVDDGATLSVVMITDENARLVKTDLIASLKTYTFASLEEVGYGLIKLSPSFYWSLVHPEDLERVRRWQEGEGIFIARVVHDTKRRYNPIGYKLYNIARDEEVAVDPAFI